MSTSTAPSAFTGQDWPNKSPTLLRMPASSWPNTICIRCPLADWFEQDGLQCYCMQRHFLTFGTRATKAAPVYACDAREVAINVEKAKAADGASA